MRHSPQFRSLVRFCDIIPRKSAMHVRGRYHIYQRMLVANAAENVIASARANDLTIVFTNNAGKLAGGANHFCVLFQRRKAAESANVEDVSVEFRQLVGKMEEGPIRAVLSQDGIGRYCGHINLGPQYYKPSSYYACALRDTTGRKRKIAFTCQ